MSNEDKEMWLANMTAAIKKLEKARTYLNKWQDELEAAEQEIAELASQTQSAQGYNIHATVTPPAFNYATQEQV